MSVPEFYGRHAGLYDRIATLPVVARWRAAAVDDLGCSSGDTVVETGCGSGANLPYLRDAVGPAGAVVGLDLTRPLLDRARDRGADGLLLADATRPPVREADALLAAFVCGMFADPGAVVDRWCDLVGPGGRIALLDATPTDRPLGRPLNPLFRAFARGTAPAESLRASVTQAVVPADDRLAAKVRDAREALVARTEARRFRTFGLGFVGVLSGRVR